MSKETNWTFLLFIILLAIISASTIIIFQQRSTAELDNWIIENSQ